MSDELPPLNKVAFENVAAALTALLPATDASIKTISQLLKANNLNESGVAYFTQQLKDERSAATQLRVFRHWFFMTFAPADHHAWGARNTTPSRKEGDRG